MTLLNRVPYQYFITKGSGDSEYEIHAGSYHMALHNAGISDFNIQTYSSILPAKATEVKPDHIKLPFGSELYTIMSCIHGKQNELLRCGIIVGELYDQNDKIGCLVCEVSGNYEKEEQILTQLQLAITDLHEKTYNNYELKNSYSLTNSLYCDNKYGTCLVAICFVSFNQENY